jgi:alanyl-tRNA synthetase
MTDFALSGCARLYYRDSIKQALAAVGGRGGGNAQLAQGSVPEPGLLETVIRTLAMG